MSSGSEYEFNFVCLGVMVDGFIEDDDSWCGWLCCNCKLVCDCDEGFWLLFGGEFVEIL